MSSLDTYRIRRISLDPAILEAPAETTTTVAITPVVEATELYHHESDCPGRQPVQMHLDIATGTLSVAYIPRGDEESIPKSVFCHRGVLWAIPCLIMSAANRLMTEAAPIAQRIIDGTTVEWDGQNNVGTHDQDATAAIDEIDRIIANYDDIDNILTEYSADEYYDDGPSAARDTLGIHADTTDHDLADITTQQAAEALSNNAIIPDLAEYLTKLREDLRDASREDLRDVAAELADVAAELERLTERRDELIRRQLSWGDVTREVGKRAGLSHSRVQAIGRKC